MGKIQLSSLISDGMILQREVENRIWGHADPGKDIRLFLGSYEKETKAGTDGYFEFVTPKMQAGGPWELCVSDGETKIIVTDILFGDVYLLGGQSNMELPITRVMEKFGEEIRKTDNPQIRMFEVPKEYLFGGTRDEIEKGQWIKATGDDLQLFSAAGYFAANELRQRENVPIGLLQTAVGGTPVKAWSCEETVEKLGYDVEELAECKREGYPKSVEEAEAKRAKLWWEEALAGQENQKGTIELSGFLNETELKGFCGAMILRKKVMLPENIDWETVDATLYLGAVIDADFAYINGEFVGNTEYCYPPRIYRIPKGVLHAGENEIEVKLLVLTAAGGFMPGKNYAICYNDHGRKQIALDGSWEYQIIKQMPILPETTFFQYKAAALYQGMLYPIRKWKIKGCFFYQGESNANRPKTYEEEFSAMILDWRKLFEEPNLPFIFVQLAGFADGKETTEAVDWAELREQQYLTEVHVQNTMMVQAYDLGEYNDLHPLDKKTVGKRIALAAEKMIYGKDVICQGAKIKEVLPMPKKVQVIFEPEDAVLHVAKEKGNNKACGFTWVKEDGSQVRAEAELVGANVVEVQRNDDASYIGIAYAWNNCPSDANLYNDANLPIVPFYVKL